ncbi:hypothetical protein E2C01_024020 [Portunus trituberculatus]|uniref:Uncharacterized protein n=1 Tax=Portunus trituberculatus TaxID=210409 RepID=A0A5B7E9C6_PORTR|nr:hypothetical protein [Portunus trituberculatus]
MPQVDHRHSQSVHGVTASVLKTLRGAPGLAEHVSAARRMVITFVQPWSESVVCLDSLQMLPALGMQAASRDGPRL